MKMDICVEIPVLLNCGQFHVYWMQLICLNFDDNLFNVKKFPKDIESPYLN